MYTFSSFLRKFLLANIFDIKKTQNHLFELYRNLMSVNEKNGINRHFQKGNINNIIISYRYKSVCD